MLLSGRSRASLPRSLGAQDRNESAFIYRQMKEKYDRVTYDTVEVPATPALVRSEFPDGGSPNLMELHDSCGAGHREFARRSEVFSSATIIRQTGFGFISPDLPLRSGLSWVVSALLKR